MKSNNIKDVLFNFTLRPFMVLSIKQFSRYQARKMTKRIKRIIDMVEKNNHNRVSKSCFNVYSVYELISETIFSNEHVGPINSLPRVVLDEILEIFEFIYTSEEIKRIKDLGALDFNTLNIKISSSINEDLFCILVWNRHLDLCISTNKNRVFFYPMTHYIFPQQMGLFNESPYYEIPGILDDLLSLIDEDLRNKSLVKTEEVLNLSWSEIQNNNTIGLKRSDCKTKDGEYFYDMVLSAFLTNRIHNSLMMTWLIGNESFEDRIKLLQWQNNDGLRNLIFIEENTLFLYCHDISKGLKLQVIYFESDNDLKYKLKSVSMQKIVNNRSLSKIMAL